MKQLGKILGAAVSFLFVAGFGLYAKDVAVFTRVVGKVQAKVGSQWVQAKPGLKIAEKSEVQTSLKGHATLQLVNGTSLQLAPGSVLSIDRLVSGNYGTATDANLRLGKVTAMVEKPNAVGQRNYFRVKTPTVVAAVRGSIQEVGYTPEMGTTVRMLEHASDVVNRNGFALVVPQGGSGKVAGMQVVTPEMAAQMGNTVVLGNGSMSAAEQEFLLNASDFTFASSAGDLADFYNFFDSLFDDLYNQGLTRIDFEKL